MTMERENKIDKLICLIESFNLQELDSYLTTYLNRKADCQLALIELDASIAILQGKVLSIAIRIKQDFLNKPIALQPVDNSLYTRKEIAKKYRVNVRTVDNWVKDGLETVLMGGTIRISCHAVETFSQTHKGKKMHWKVAA